MADIRRMWAYTNERERPGTNPCLKALRKKTILQTSWSWTSASLQSCEKINFCSLSHPRCVLCYRTPGKLIYQSETSLMLIEVVNFLVRVFDIFIIRWKIITVSTFQCIKFCFQFQWKRLTDNTPKPILILTFREEENRNSYLNNRITNFQLPQNVDLENFKNSSWQVYAWPLTLEWLFWSRTLGGWSSMTLLLTSKSLSLMISKQTNQFSKCHNIFCGPTENAHSACFLPNTVFVGKLKCIKSF